MAPSIHIHRLCIAATLLLLVPVLNAATPPTPVYILAGQSNMVGMGALEHLQDLVANDPRFAEFRGDNNSTIRVYDNVTVYYNNHTGPCTAPGFGGSPHHFGVELGLASILNAQSPTILLKTAWGGRSLAVDFRPPSAGVGNYSHIPPEHYGWEYRQMIHDVRFYLEQLTHHEHGIAVRLAGLIWFQGWNDVIAPAFVDEYASNLRHFLKDVRQDLGAPPDWPVIIAELGMHGLHPEGRAAARILHFRRQQQSVTLLPEFRNTTRFCRTAAYAVTNGTTYGGIYHYNGRADTYVWIGQAMGRALQRLAANPRPSVTQH